MEFDASTEARTTYKVKMEEGLIVPSIVTRFDECEYFKGEDKRK